MKPEVSSSGTNAIASSGGDGDPLPQRGDDVPMIDPEQERARINAVSKSIGHRSLPLPPVGLPPAPPATAGEPRSPGSTVPLLAPQDV